MNGETLTIALGVSARDFGEAEAQPDPPASAAANEEFRNVIWAQYEAQARDKLWHGAFLCPVELYTVLLDYGQTRVMDGARTTQSNSTLLYTIPGDPVRAPADGVVVVAQNLALTGNTIVIDHGCGLRSYLYGLADLHVEKGQSVARGRRHRPGRGGADHGFQDRQQEHQPLAPVPDQRRAVLAGILTLQLLCNPLLRNSWWMQPAFSAMLEPPNERS